MGSERPGGLGWQPSQTAVEGTPWSIFTPAAAGMPRTAAGAAELSRATLCAHLWPSAAPFPLLPARDGRRGCTIHLAVWGGAVRDRRSGGGSCTRGARERLALALGWSSHHVPHALVAALPRLARSLLPSLYFPHKLPPSLPLSPIAQDASFPSASASSSPVGAREGP